MAERRTVLSASLLGLAAAAPAAAQTEAKPLAGKAALVTGAARGIGRATAVELARQGAAVALLDIADPDAIPELRGYRLASRAELEEAARLVRAEGARALPLVADVRDWEAMRRATERAARELGGGRLDVVVANAGIAIDGKLARYEPAPWRAMLDVNLTGALNTVQAALPGLRRPGGRIILVTSVQARTGSVASGAYATTKWGMTGLMKSLAAELGPEGITVNAVAPTGVDTPMVGRASEGRGKAHPCTVHSGHALPVDLLEPAEIATAIAFLAGPGAGFVSGTTLDVNAGKSAQLSA
ncbi:SDR family NAD(P)-dependent oxidoreductase [Craurococcus roseus]|uniref:SDR family NAD(P)-dependent oxidoreductase n=1 Tax=Craurococcus roseus TaxID=77585 RepID=A0ABP3Q0Q9_9PROT